ncbi:DUF1569 domain-containing protein [Blastopirellula marina]|uniref:DUF1569 domain-containing protein n=1 Tax=Blastopirellula marina TaxID=124 RepID=A0A2S8F9B6_9BACT|nr:DUF1569 domain-containing protein [Blastopirellula marina]PQO28730.1 hypothetical protein C5Y98_23385 [Blastopirellula marina]PTL42003.1 DUF1569 domain-containing protein [Blastopirellula marina]
MSFHRNGASDRLSRRQLSLQSFDDVLAEAKSLSRVGYHRVSKWSLGQICDHVSRFMDDSIDGFKSTPGFAPLMRPFLRMMYLGKVLRNERIPAKMPTLKELEPDEWTEDGNALPQLEKAIARIQDPNTQFVPSPAFGNLTAEQWRKVHLWHCQHHLEFLIPAARDAQANSPQS